ncbi:hypothetical protein Har1131_18270 [Haloarcula sp. CBA1131]|nr:hypothetical protein Har1131_18270 [Haloarcula sp. CBA1131]
MSLCLRCLIWLAQLQILDRLSVDGLPANAAATLFDPPHCLLPTTSEISNTPRLVVGILLKRKDKNGV